jgi:glycosyltransferase involved in cell wall biosynthesis
VRALRRAGSAEAHYDVVFHAPWLTPLLTPSSGLPAGGAETQIFLLATGLAANGARVGLLVEEGPDLPERVAGVDVIRQPVSSRSRRAGRAVENIASLARILSGLDAQVVVQRAAGSRTGLIASVMKLRRRRFVYSSASVFDFEFGRLGHSHHAVLLFRLGIRLADAIVVQTFEQEELCRTRFGRSAEVIRSIAEVATATEAQPEAFLWIGLLAHYKQPFAYVELARAVPEAHFRMIGVPAGEMGRAIQEEITEAARGLPNLELLHPRPRAELMPLIERAVAVVNTASYEGMPNIFLEGWARGVPALALAHDPDGVIRRERLGEFADGDAERLAALARALWEGRAEREAAAMRCREYVERHHAPDLVVQRWAKVLDIA